MARIVIQLASFDWGLVDISGLSLHSSTIDGAWLAAGEKVSLPESKTLHLVGIRRRSPAVGQSGRRRLSHVGRSIQVWRQSLRRGLLVLRQRVEIDDVGLAGSFLEEFYRRTSDSDHPHGRRSGA